MTDGTAKIRRIFTICKKNIPLHPTILNTPYMKRFFLAALLLFAAVAFTGCDNDDDDLYDTLSGRVWAGDLGFYQDGRIPLDS